MIFTVLWKPLAEEELASIWIDAQDRQTISAAANEIDKLLRVDPQSQGESRSGSQRVLIMEPLVVAFEVEEDDRRVSALSVRFHKSLAMTREELKLDLVYSFCSEELPIRWNQKHPTLPTCPLLSWKPSVRFHGNAYSSIVAASRSIRRSISTPPALDVAAKLNCARFRQYLKWRTYSTPFLNGCYNQGQWL